MGADEEAVFSVRGGDSVLVISGGVGLKKDGDDPVADISEGVGLKEGGGTEKQ